MRSHNHEPHIPVGQRTLTFDFPGLEVGVAEYAEGPTGCTVFNIDGGATFHADVRGGAIGTVNADHGYAHAFCFSGGSLPGQEAVAGVAADWHEGFALAASVVDDGSVLRTIEALRRSGDEDGETLP